ncbi:MAG: hypothetical protein ACI814_001487 [Mariniblastus sp.]|jgi:hypothetical protein
MPTSVSWLGSSSIVSTESCLDWKLCLRFQPLCRQKTLLFLPERVNADNGKLARHRFVARKKKARGREPRTRAEEVLLGYFSSDLVSSELVSSDLGSSDLGSSDLVSFDFF